MVLHNPNNWHWVNKDASAWAREFLEKELMYLRAEEGDVSAEITKLISMDGDVDVNQRKGKVLTLFDVKLQLEYAGKTKDDEDVSGSITIPEVAHDTAEDEYVFDIDIYSETNSKEPVKDLVRRKLTPLLRQHLAKLGPSLIAEHGKGLQHEPGYTSVVTPKYNSSSISKSTDKAASTATSTAASSGKGVSVNVTTVTDTAEFRTEAAQLYLTFTDPQRVAAFTRAPPRVFEAKQGGKFELFDGNVSGEFVELHEPTKIVQKWRLKQWPEGHYSTLNVNFDQNDVDAVTVMRVDWQGVPVGQEEVTQRNWQQYYVRSIKTTFGFGTIL
ncbi:activator of 90 kDa heat shock protein ATPase-like protein 1 [Viridothelium virens]|uniref:Activator of 90 kDa heat shock protein ATPase-like protein 1 n=1 Tax=Viridothelium virens TaxID=1048519 RepID=A0A6A6H811_VIRVR|nr:activator of 90 kDa heat shock protein ATPase-like protein 1 [Viridothelium virens]